MSGVESSGGKSGSDERVRQLREEYRKKESELNKKHNQQLRRVSESHLQELDKVKANHTTQMKNLREKSKETISRRDAKYQNDINSLRSLHHKQLKKMNQDNEFTMKQVIDSSQRQIKQANLGKEDRVGALHERYKTIIKEKENQNNQKIEAIREAQTEATTKVRNDLTEHYEDRLSQKELARNTERAKLKKEFNSMRSHLTNELDDVELKALQDKNRLSKNFMDNLKDERISHNELMARNTDGFQESLREIKEKQAEAMEKRKEMTSQVARSHKKEVNDRIARDIVALERKNKLLEKENVRNQMKYKQQAQKTISQYKDAYQDKYENLERTKKEAIETHNQDRVMDIKKIVDKKDAQLHDSSRFYRNKMEMENFKNRQAINSISKDFEVRELAQKDMADMRVGRILNDSKTKEVKLRKAFDQNIEVLREDNSKDKKSLLLKYAEEKGDIVKRMNIRYQKQEVEHEKQVSDLDSKHKAELEQIKENMRREKMLTEKREKHIISSMKNQHHFELDTVKDKYETQQKEAQIRHQKEIQDLNRRHQESMNELIATMQRNNNLDKV